MGGTDTTEQTGLEELLEYLRDARGFDFTAYKRTSLARRIQRRMQVVGLDDFAAYRSRLRDEPDEFNALFNTILINVTSFIRYPDALEALAHRAAVVILRVR